MQSSVRLQSLQFSQTKTYLAATIFIAGNIVLPQLFHLVPQGGVTWLPIYFFTLIGAYMMGWRVGLLTALLSPVINAMLFGMPMVAALPAILLKSTLLALIASAVASHCQKVTIGLLLAVVLSYQTLGTLGEWAMKADFIAACQDFRIGIPGMLLQVFGGWAVLTLLLRQK